jgi:Metal-dependent hydrolases of the beta-lactamase superfamily II
MSYTITTLVENAVYGKGLQAEHGLSMLVDTGKHKVLIDTGASDLFIHNARVLGIDLSEVDYLILSHGHYDHTGGVHQFLALNTKAKLVCKREALLGKFKEGQNIGIKGAEKIDESRLLIVDTTTEIIPDLFVLPQIKIVDKNDTHFEHFFTERDGIVVPDTFEDELAVALLHGKYLSILSSCSHRGITNVIRGAQEAFPDLALHLVMGGFHIHNAESDKFSIISGFLGRKLPRRLGICHCTGIDKFALFHQQFNDRVFYNYTGWVESF